MNWQGYYPPPPPSPYYRSPTEDMRDVQKFWDEYEEKKKKEKKEKEEKEKKPPMFSVAQVTIFLIATMPFTGSAMVLFMLKMMITYKEAFATLLK